MVRIDEATLNDPYRIDTEKFQQPLLWTTLLKAVHEPLPLVGSMSAQ